MTETLAELFARDPLDYAKQDIEVIVARLREARAQFLIAESAPKVPKAKAKKAVKDLLAQTASESIDLKALGL